MQFLTLGAAVGSSLLATALANVPQSSSNSSANKKHSKGGRQKKFNQKQSPHLLESGNNFDNGITHLTTSTPIPKQKISKFRVPLPTPHDVSSRSRTEDTLALDKLLRQIVGSRVQPFKYVILISFYNQVLKNHVVDYIPYILSSNAPFSIAVMDLLIPTRMSF